MSEEAWELVSRLYERWAQGDLGGGGALDPDIEYARIGPAGAGLAGEYRGIDQLTRALTEWLESWTDVRVRAERIVALGNGRVLVLAHQTGLGRESGTPLDLRTGDIWTVRNGKAIRLESYWDRAEALKAAGLSE